MRRMSVGANTSRTGIRGQGGTPPICPKIIAFYLGVILLPGCTLYQKPIVPSNNPPDAFEVSLEAREFRNLNNTWWRNFNIPELNEVVDKALANNFSYQATLKNIDIAQTYVLQNMTLLFPQLGLDYSYSRNKSIIDVGNAVSAAPQLSGTSGIIDLQLLTATVNYEIDAWNQVHNSVEQAKADKETAIGNTNIFRLTLISSVVNTYFQIASLNEIIENFSKQYEDAREIAELTQVLYQSGLVDDSSVLTAKNQAESIYVNLKTAEKQRQVYQFTMAYLVGEYPENYQPEIKVRLGDIRYAELVPGAVPAQMLGTRPDVKAAFSSVLSFGFIEKQNIANFLPGLSLSGTYGYANNRISHLIKQSNALWNYGFNMIQLIVDYPQLYAAWKRSEIQYKQAIDNYHNTVINAFAEVDGSIASYKDDILVLDSSKRQLDNSLELVDIASAQYQAGLTDYITYLTTDLTMLQTDYNLTLKELLLTQDVVTLYKALGLGILEESDEDGKNS